MSRPREYFIAKIALVTLLAAGVSGKARAQDPTTDPSTQGYAAFASTLTSLTTASSVLVQSPDERSAGRLLFLRKALATKLTTAIASGKPFTFTDLDARSLLCDFRARVITVVSKGNLSARDPAASVTVDFLGARANVKYLTAVAGKINAAAPAKPTDIISALQLLFTNYNFQVGAVTVSNANRDSVEYPCNKDMSEFATAYYGTTIVAPLQVAEAPFGGAAPATSAGISLPDLSIFGPIGAFIQTALGIITPVVEDIATFESAQARQEAIIKFLSDPKNEAAMNAAGMNLAQAISDYTFTKRLSLAGTFTEQVAAIKAASIDPTKIASCNPPLPPAASGASPPTLTSVMLPANRSTAPNDLFMLCYRAVWTTMQDQISSALTTAASYDALADPGDTATLLTQFRKQAADSFAQIKTPPADQTSLQYILAVVSFASDVATAVSPTNRSKLEQAITAMVKAY
jgi:hypothetical protein